MNKKVVVGRPTIVIQSFCNSNNRKGLFCLFYLINSSSAAVQDTRSGLLYCTHKHTTHPHTHTAPSLPSTPQSFSIFSFWLFVSCPRLGTHLNLEMFSGFYFLFPSVRLVPNLGWISGSRPWMLRLRYVIVYVRMGCCLEYCTVLITVGTRVLNSRYII